MIRSMCMFVVAAVAFAGANSQVVAAEPAEESKKVLIVVGPSTHPPGTHEVEAGARVMEYCVNHLQNVGGVSGVVSEGWPEDAELLSTVDSVVFIGDTFPPQRLAETARILKELDGMMRRGCGIVCVHYATGLRNEDVAADGEHPLLHWMGGYFATRCEHHQSVARIFEAATVEPATPEHPLSRGWKTFTVHDEPYINNYFGPDDNRLRPNVTAIATSMLPPESPQREVIAWSVEREDGGRGFGIVMPHFYRNWKQDDLRTLILNGIVWSAGAEVPTEGVAVDLPDLDTFAPGSVEPKPRTRESKR